MVARVRTVAFHGVEVIEVETQATIASGLPAFAVVGLPDKAVAEARERVRAAFSASASRCRRAASRSTLPRLTS
jgi:magnesium chelatase family protein